MKNLFKNAVYTVFFLFLSLGTSAYTLLPQDISIVADRDDVPDPLTLLKEGNERFYAGQSKDMGVDTTTIFALAKGQHPMAVIVGCSDSRVSPELVFNQGLGELFVIRTAGAVVDDLEIGSIEYGIEHLHSKLIVVMGHSSCGAIGAMLEHKHDDDVPPHISSIIQTLKSQPEMANVLNSADSDLSDLAVFASVQHGVNELRNSEPILGKLYDEGEIDIIGAIYDVATGKVEFYSF